MQDQLHRSRQLGADIARLNTWENVKFLHHVGKVCEHGLYATNKINAQLLNCANSTICLRAKKFTEAGLMEAVKRIKCKNGKERGTLYRITQRGIDAVNAVVTETYNKYAL